MCLFIEVLFCDVYIFMYILIFILFKTNEQEKLTRHNRRDTIIINKLNNNTERVQ